MIQLLQPKPWTQRFFVHCVQRETNTADGNPRWLLHLGLADQVTAVIRTQPDAQFTLEDLTALEHTSILVTITAGVVTNIERS